MIVIASAAYIEPEFQVEFGKLPPCMLPLGNRRLFEHQIRILRDYFADQEICISLPEYFDLSPNDDTTLRNLGVNLIFVPEHLALAESFLFVINSIGKYDGVLRLLHGDTLLEEFPPDDNVIGVAQTHDDYNWEIEKVGNADELVWCGYFSFSDIKTLVKCLNKGRGNFVDAIRNYGQKVPFHLKEFSIWHDLGHVNTYFKSRACITTERSFNELTIQEGYVRKGGKHSQKIMAEAQWFLTLPPSLKRFIPQLIETGQSSSGAPYYVLEHLSFSALNELFVHGRNPPFFWKKMFRHCNNFLSLCQREAGNIFETKNYDFQTESNGIILHKTRKRLEEFSLSNSIDLDRPTIINGQPSPSINSIAERCIKIATSAPPIPGVFHGDFCLSNILFDSRSELLKVIDPRGLNFQGEFSLLGDLRYDLAKLSHSVIGLYDFILAGAFHLECLEELNFNLYIQIDDRIKTIQEVFLEYNFIDQLKPVDIAPIMVLLFLSMLPLHSDSNDRQMALLANAIRLYNDYIN